MIQVGDDVTYIALKFNYETCIRSVDLYVG